MVIRGIDSRTSGSIDGQQGANRVVIRYSRRYSVCLVTVGHRTTIRRIANHQQVKERNEWKGNPEADRIVGPAPRIMAAIVKLLQTQTEPKP